MERQREREKHNEKLQLLKFPRANYSQGQSTFREKMVEEERLWAQRPNVEVITEGPR